MKLDDLRARLREQEAAEEAPSSEPLKAPARTVREFTCTICSSAAVGDTSSIATLMNVCEACTRIGKVDARKAVDLFSQSVKMQCEMCGAESIHNVRPRAKKATLTCPRCGALETFTPLSEDATCLVCDRSFKRATPFDAYCSDKCMHEDARGTL